MKEKAIKKKLEEVKLSIAEGEIILGFLEQELENAKASKDKDLINTYKLKMGENKKNLEINEKWLKYLKTL